MLRSITLDSEPTGLAGLVTAISGLTLVVTRPGITGIGLPGSGTSAGIGVPATISLSG